MFSREDDSHCRVEKRASDEDFKINSLQGDVPQYTCGTCHAIVIRSVFFEDCYHNTAFIKHAYIRNKALFFCICFRNTQDTSLLLIYVV